MMEGKPGNNKEQGLEKHYMYDISQTFCHIGKILEKAAFRKGKLVHGFRGIGSESFGPMHLG